MTVERDSRRRALRSLREKEKADALCALNAALDRLKQVEAERGENRSRMAEASARLSEHPARGGTSGGRMARALEARRMLRTTLERHRSIEARLARDEALAESAVDAARERVAQAQRALNAIGGKER